jgi:hypothetical protein
MSTAPWIAAAALAAIHRRTGMTEQSSKGTALITTKVTPVTSADYTA